MVTEFVIERYPDALTPMPLVALTDIRWLLFAMALSIVAITVVFELLKFEMLIVKPPSVELLVIALCQVFTPVTVGEQFDLLQV